MTARALIVLAILAACGAAMLDACHARRDELERLNSNQPTQEYP
jgi:hypothetical protein